MNQSDANAIVRAAWAQVFGTAPSDSEAAYTQAVAWLENQYGRAGQFAALAAKSEFNWGSLHAAGKPPNCPSGSAPGSDVGSVCFRVFPSDQAAAAAFVSELARNPKYNRDKVRAAMAGSPEDVAQAMFDTKYYQGVGTSDSQRVQNYANSIRSALTTIGQNGAVPNPATAGSSSLATFLTLAAIGGGAYWLVKKGGYRTVRREAKHLFSSGRRVVRRYA